jgi:hypothetical protein
MFSAAELPCEGILVGRAIEAAHRRAVGAGAGSGELRACSRRASTSIRRPCTQIEGRRSKKSPPPPSCRKSNSGQRRRPCPHAAAPDLLPDAMRLRRMCSPMARPRPADRAPAPQRFSGYLTICHSYRTHLFKSHSYFGNYTFATFTSGCLHICHFC